MGIDITQLPGMGGDTGSIVQESVSAIENSVECVAMGSLLSCFEAVINFALLAFDVYQALFPSRPKVGRDSASDDTALFFIPSSNPVIALWGIGIRQLESLGIPTSTSGGPGYTAQLNLANSVLADLKKQYDAPGAPTFSVHGVPTNGTQMFDWYHLLGFQTHNPDSNAAVIAQRVLLDRTYEDMVKVGFIDPTTGFPKPPPGPPPPPPLPTCPPGFIWDKALERCVEIPQGKCPPGQHWDVSVGRCVPDTATGVQPFDPDGDEFTDCCDETQAALAQILQALGALRGGGNNDTCCASVVAAIGTITTQLAKLTILIQNASGGAGVDLAPLVAQLSAIAAGISKLAGGAGAPIEVSITNPTPLATATATAEPPDLTELIKALKENNELQDVPQALIDQLLADDMLSPEYAQLAQGAAYVKVRPGVYPYSPTTWLTRLDRWFKGKGPPTYPKVASVSSGVTSTTKDIFTDVFNASKTVFGPIVSGVLKAHRDEIAKLRNVDPCQEAGAANDLLTEAIGASVAAHFASVGVEAIYPTKNLGFEKIADVIAAIAGVEDIIGGLIGVEIAQLVKIPHRYCINEQGRTILPGAGAAASAYARGLITEPQVRQLMGFNGVNRQYENSTIDAAFGGINPRQLIRLMNTGLFADADITDELTFAGIRPASQHRLLLAAPYLATATYRSKLHAALEAAYTQGLLSDADLTSQFDSAEHNTDRDSLVLDTVRLQEQVVLAKALETEYTTGYLAGMTTQPAYEGQIRGLPFQAWKADAIIGVAEAKRNATIFRRDEAAARALERQTAAAERRTAMQSYESGFSDAVTLTAALVATGLTVPEAAAWVALAALKKQGNVRWLYDMQLSPQQAEIIRARVAAATDQRKHALLTDAQYDQVLKDLKLSDKWRNALRAAANATLSPAKARTFTAVQPT